LKTEKNFVEAMVYKADPTSESIDEYRNFTGF
jgi:hypothetical protein